MMEWLFVYKYISSLLQALTSKFYFAKIVRIFWPNVDDWARHKLKTIFWLRSAFSRSCAVLFLVKNMTSETSFWLESRKRIPLLHSNCIR